MDNDQWVNRRRYGLAFEGPPADSLCGQPPRRLQEILSRIPPEVVDRFSGCGSPVPEAIEGRRVVDLGCGTGRDAYLCAALVGPSGFVLGLDRDEAHLAVARRNVEAAMSASGFPEPNIAFRKGQIEAMGEAGIEDEAFDVAISNRALNLVPDKLRVLREVFRVLIPGGEFYFSDVYADRRLPEELAHQPEIIREQLGGALYIGDFVRLARRAGFTEPRVVSRCPLELADPDLQARLGGMLFWVVTFRLFKLPELEDGEEDYGQAALYRGTIQGCAHHFVLDAENRFETGRIGRIGGNTALILQTSRLAPHFKLFGTRNRHFGPFAG